MSLTPAFISHQIWLQRNATNEVNELRPFIEQMRKEVKQAVLAFGELPHQALGSRSRWG